MTKKGLKSDLKSEIVVLKNNQSRKKSDYDLNQEILRQLQKNEKISREILDSVVFIKQHYYWRTVLNFLKVFLVLAVIILGIVSWRGIVDYISSSLPGDFQGQVLNQH